MLCALAPFPGGPRPRPCAYPRGCCTRTPRHRSPPPQQPQPSDQPRMSHWRPPGRPSSCPSQQVIWGVGARSPSQERRLCKKHLQQPRLLQTKGGIAPSSRLRWRSSRDIGHVCSDEISQCRRRTLSKTSHNPVPSQLSRLCEVGTPIDHSTFLVLDQDVGCPHHLQVGRGFRIAANRSTKHWS